MKKEIRYDYTVKYNKMKWNMEMNYTVHKNYVYQEESNNTIWNYYRAYNFGNMKLCCIVFWRWLNDIWYEYY